MPMDRQLIDHRPIALDPGLALDDAIEQQEEAVGSHFGVTIRLQENQ